MFGSIVIDTFLGLVLTYIILSLCCMTISELIAAFFNLRAKTLETGLSSMIDDPALVDKIYNHPLIFGLWQSSGEKKKEAPPKDAAFSQVAATVSHDMQRYCQSVMLRPPSYIPSRQFTTSIIDLIRSAKSDCDNIATDLRHGIQTMQDSPFKYALISMLDDAKGDVDHFRAKLEYWFNDGMDRISGWYRRYIQRINVGVGLAVAIVCNADTFQIINGFYHDAALRSAAINAAAVFSTGSISIDISSGMFPMGWGTPLPSNWLGWPLKLLGWLLTSAALSLGAPFWFDVLNKFVNVRLTGKKPDSNTNCNQNNLGKICPLEKAFSCSKVD